MLHILVGDNQGDIKLVSSFAKTRQPLFWTVPKKALPGDPVLFSISAHGFIARGMIGTAPKLDSQKKYMATVVKIEELPYAMPLEYVLKFHRAWKWPNFPLKNTSIDGAIQTQLEELLNRYEGMRDDEQEGTPPPTAKGDKELTEGSINRTPVSKYERNPIARKKCIEYYGRVCSACNLSFGKRYGKVAAGFIHVHHLKPLATAGGKYVVDPIEDLRPICPNCHAVIHMRVPPIPIEALKKMLKDARRPS